MFKDELGGKIMKEFCTLRAKTYAYLMDDDREKVKAKATKKFIHNVESCLKTIKIRCSTIIPY